MDYAKESLKKHYEWHGKLETVPKMEVKDKDAVENPEQPPQYETQPEQKPEEPAGGSTNDSGQVYVPGFGYVDQPGTPQGESAGSDGDWNKQIGDMN